MTMTMGFVLVKTRHDRVRHVYDRLSSMEGVLDINPIFGDYDMIFQVETSSARILGEKVIREIRTTADVVSTLTLQAVDL